MSLFISYRRHTNGWTASANGFISNPHFKQEDARKELISLIKGEDSEEDRLSVGLSILENPWE
jgi:hypothetical protein